MIIEDIRNAEYCTWVTKCPNFAQRITVQVQCVAVTSSKNRDLNSGTPFQSPSSENNPYYVRAKSTRHSNARWSDLECTEGHSRVDSRTFSAGSLSAEMKQKTGKICMTAQHPGVLSYIYWSAVKPGKRWYVALMCWQMAQVKSKDLYTAVFV